MPRSAAAATAAIDQGKRKSLAARPKLVPDAARHSALLRARGMDKEEERALSNPVTVKFNTRSR
jgi:hypothetical protein